MNDLIKQLLQILVDLVIYLTPRQALTTKRLSEAKIVAHRGWFDEETVKENTLESFDSAFKNNIWGIEFDIRWTKDHIPVLCHDDTTFRVWDKNITIKDINFVDLRSQLPGIPTLEEVVEKYGKKLFFFIELKSVDYTYIEIYKEKLQEILTPLDAGKDFSFLALSIEPVLKFNCFEPCFYFLVAETNTLEMSQLALEYKLGGLTGHFLLLNQNIVHKHHSEAQLVGTGFCRTKKSMARELTRGVDFIFTNHPWNLI